MIEQGREISRGRLIAFGPNRALISTGDVLREDARLVLTVTVPETRREKTQAVFRLSGRVHYEEPPTGPAADRHDYLLQLAPDDENLRHAGELFTRFRTQGIVET